MTGDDWWSWSYRLEVPDAADRTPEQWARDVFEGGGVPGPVRALLVAGWRYGLGLRLAPTGADDSVLGWRIAGSSEYTVVLRAESPLMRAVHTVGVERRVVAAVTWTTTIQPRGRPGRLLWGAVAPVHRFTLPMFLKRAARLTPPPAART